MKKIYYYIIGIALFIVGLMFDKQISIFFTSYRTPILDNIAIFIDYLKWYILFSLVLIVVLISRDHKKIIPLALSFVLYFLIVNVLKMVVARPRPYVDLNNELVNVTNPYRSFPSGHATSVSLLIPFFNSSVSGAIWWVIVIIISLSRVYLGVHYLSDVIFGIMLGYLIGEFSLYLVNKKKIMKLFYRKV